MLRRGGRARHLHPEDAVASRIVVVVAAAGFVAFAAVAVAALGSCGPRTPSPSAALEGRRGGPRGARDASASGDDEEEEAEDRAALDAGLSVRALSCVADRDCMTHRCDVELERCRFPCRSDDDCNPGASCAVDGGAFAACFNR